MFVIKIIDEKFLNFYKNLFNIGYVIVTPSICLIGFILNLICFIVFMRLKEKIFFYLAIKSLAESCLFSLGAIQPYISCLNCNLHNAYERALITLIFTKFANSSIYFLITILEIEIALNRYFLIASYKTKSLAERKDKIKVLIYTIISITIFVPCFLAFDIKRQLPFANEYKLELNDFGKSDLYHYFYTYIGLFRNILSILILLPLNIIIIIKFKKYIKNKSLNAAFVTRQNNAKIETRFTKMIFLISFLFIYSRLFEIIAPIFDIYNEFFKVIDNYSFYYTIINIFVFLNTYIIFSLNFFVFYFLNNIFCKEFKKIFYPCSK